MTQTQALRRLTYRQVEALANQIIDDLTLATIEVNQEYPHAEAQERLHEVIIHSQIVDESIRRSLVSAVITHLVAERVVVIPEDTGNPTRMPVPVPLPASS